MTLLRPLLAALLSTALAIPARADAVNGTSAAEILTGSTAASVLKGGAGNDTLYGDPLSGVGVVKIERLNAGKALDDNGYELSDPVFSPDGKWIAALGHSAVAGVIDQVVLINVSTRATTLVTRDGAGTLGDGAAYGQIAFSPDSKRIAFSTAAKNLADGATNGKLQILESAIATPGTFKLLSRANDAMGLQGDGDSANPSYSADGTRVSFESEATNLIGANDTNAVRDIFLADTADHKKLVLASVDINGNQGDKYSAIASFAPVENKLIFASGASNFPGGGMFDHMYIKTLGAQPSATGKIPGLLDIVDESSSGALANGPGTGARFSPDGHSVVMVSVTTNLGPPVGATFQQRVYHKRIGGAVNLVSTNKKGELANDQAYGLDMTPDQSKVMFISPATNLTNDNLSGITGVFAKDILSGDIALLSRKPGGPVADVGSSSLPAISPDGKTIAFASKAKTLTDDNPLGLDSVFLATLSAPTGSADTLDGGTGADRMAGGPGNDTYVVDNTGDSVVELAGAGTDTVKSSVTHTLSPYAERLTLTGTAKIKGTGNALANILTGNGKASTLYGLGGNDTYVLGTGDLASETGGSGVDTVNVGRSYTLASTIENLTLTGSGAYRGTGNNAANILVGNAKANVIKGLGGNDRITGGGGRDTLSGGAGADVFVYARLSDSAAGRTKRDAITDFAASADRIDLSAIDANTRQKGKQVFRDIGRIAFSGAGGEVRFEAGLLQADVNGDRKADFQISLKGVKKLPAAALILAP